MYGLSAKFDVGVFVKKELTLVSFTANTINLFFGQEVSITIIGSFIYSLGELKDAIKISLPVLSSNLMCLIGKVVRHAERQDDGSLILQFENGHDLIILDDSREYESYSIRIGSSEIIV